ncbi:DNA-binding transcriptional MerR regulator [Agrobacterium larrymoorei]|uniref:DNA-binding transcriptional MerR regulator n=2 Tax=Agrobacterium larrymoorei TaxID=160699 RepID=A0ABU0UN56_9HYPH|nr:DNA-binding transcriptional MerR regulator [Agrobacterium larrymoorei]
MTQSLSLEDADFDLDTHFVSETGAAVMPELAVPHMNARGQKGREALPVKPGSWSSKSMRKASEPAATQGSKSPKGFLPDVKVPSSLPPEPVVIADMANLFGVTHRTLHFYEEKKILSSRRMGLMRIYSHQDVHRMAVVNLLRDIGVAVAIIQEIMGKLDHASSQEEADDIFQTALEIRKRELTLEISTVHRQIDQISNLMDVSDETYSEPQYEAAFDLTDQEKSCLELMAEGYSSTRLSRTLGMSAEELSGLEEGLLGKFGVNNRFQVVAKALTMGVIQS